MKIIAFMRAYYVHVIIAAAALWVASRRFMNDNERFRWTVRRYALKMQLFGGIILKSFASRFSRTLGTLLQCVVPVLKRLEMSEEIIDTLPLKKSCAGSTTASPTGA